MGVGAVRRRGGDVLPLSGVGQDNARQYEMCVWGVDRGWTAPVAAAEPPGIWTPCGTFVATMVRTTAKL